MLTTVPTHPETVGGTMYDTKATLWLHTPIAVAVINVCVCVCMCVCAGESAVEIGNGKFTWETPERSALTESVHTNTQAHTHT